MQLVWWCFSFQPGGKQEFFLTLSVFVSKRQLSSSVNVWWRSLLWSIWQFSTIHFQNFCVSFLFDSLAKCYLGMRFEKCFRFHHPCKAQVVSVFFFMWKTKCLKTGLNFTGKRLFYLSDFQNVIRRNMWKFDFDLMEAKIEFETGLGKIFQRNWMPKLLISQLKQFRKNCSERDILLNMKKMQTHWKFLYLY